MTKAVVPTEFPELPEDGFRWRRALRRGSIFHAIDALGHNLCNGREQPRNSSESPSCLGDMQYWGVCPRCHKKATA